MAKIKLKGADSGSAVYTLTTGTGSTDRTINLPDGSGTLAFTTGDDDKLPLSGGALTGALTTNSTIDGRDVAADGVTADAALPKAGGTLTGDLNFGDNVDANFGAGGDLKIYHDGNHSRIQDAGTGDLILSGQIVAVQNAGHSETMAKFNENGDVKLYHNDALKIATTATGATVTGAVSADSSLIRGSVVQVQGLHLTPSGVVTSAGAPSELSSTLRIAFTPKHASSKLIHEFYAPYNFPDSTHLQYAYFYDVTAGAIALGSASAGSRKPVHWGARTSNYDANDFDNLSMRSFMNAASTNARTYTIWHGTEGSTASFGVSPLSNSSGATWPMVYTITEIYNP